MKKNFDFGKQGLLLQETKFLAHNKWNLKNVL